MKLTKVAVEKKPRGYKPTAEEVINAVLMLTLMSHRDTNPRSKGPQALRRTDGLWAPTWRWESRWTAEEVADYIGCSKQAARVAMRRPPTEFEVQRGDVMGAYAIEGLKLHEAHSRGNGGMAPETYSVSTDLLLERLAAAFALAVHEPSPPGPKVVPVRDVKVGDRIFTTNGVRTVVGRAHNVAGVHLTVDDVLAPPTVITFANPDITVEVQL